MTVTDDADGLLKRLEVLVSEVSRSEIARRTGTSLMNVSRYLSGTRVPAVFCTALVRELGVNPGWLLTGEGSPYVSDLARGHERMAGDLLELVEAMNAVTRMRLGSLAGRDHMKMLRTLNDGLQTHERLRKKMNEHSRGILSEILSELERALARMDMKRATPLLKSAEQVARLCDDEELAARLLSVQGHHAYLSGRRERALEIQRKRFIETIASGKPLGEEAALFATRLVIALSDSGRADEARRVAEAAIALAGDAAQDSEQFASMQGFYGLMLMQRGELDRALSTIQHSLSPQTGYRRGVSLATLAQVQVLAGVLTLKEALKAPGLPDLLHVNIADLASVAEDIEVLEACCRFFNSAQARIPKERSFAPHIAPILLRALTDRDRGVVKELDAVLKAGEAPVGKLQALAVKCQLQRLVGTKAAAVRTWKDADQLLGAMREQVAASLLVRALHHLNAMLLDTVGVAAAREFFERHAAYHFGHEALSAPQPT